MKPRNIKVRRLTGTLLSGVVLIFSSAGNAQEPVSSETTTEPMIPIFKSPPNYPRSALEQGIEGWVYAQFMVLKDGTVLKESIVVLDEEPKSIFTTAALRSAESLRFEPRNDATGTPVDVEGVTYLFHFAFKPSSTNSYFSDSYTGRQPPIEIQ